VLATDCTGFDLSQVEFAFDCLEANGGGLVRHSFGRGGFDVNEEFDTEVRCERCMPPTPSRAHSRLAAAAAAAAASPSRAMSSAPPSATRRWRRARRAAKAHAAGRLRHTNSHASKHDIGIRTASVRDASAHSPPFLANRRPMPAEATLTAGRAHPDVGRPKDLASYGFATVPVHYGPKGCVSTYKSKTGHCIIQTRCSESDINNYSFGLVCVDKLGAPVRHLFGKDSFDAEEKFDTLIECDQCLGLEDVPDHVAVNGEVLSLNQEIKSLAVMMKNVATSVDKLNAQVFKAPARASAPPAKRAIRGAGVRRRGGGSARRRASLVRQRVRHRGRRRVDAPASTAAPPQAAQVEEDSAEEVGEEAPGPDTTMLVGKDAEAAPPAIEAEAVGGGLEAGAAAASEAAGPGGGSAGLIPVGAEPAGATTQVGVAEEAVAGARTDNAGEASQQDLEAAGGDAEEVATEG